MKLLLLGPQGSGKTTQAKLLSKNLGVCAICAGEMMRELAKSDTVAGRSVKESLEQGQLVDSRIVTDAVLERISQPECKEGFVIDGPPRKLSDMEFFNPHFDFVFYLSVPDEVVLERLLKRGREDDTPELIKTRLSLYREETQPILDHYEALGNLVKIDASGSVEEVNKAIISQIKK